mgnify:CR=1 FL=1
MSDVIAGELATEATSLWLLGEFEGALQTLQRLEGCLGGDSKVRAPCIAHACRPSCALCCLHCRRCGALPPCALAFDAPCADAAAGPAQHICSTVLQQRSAGPECAPRHAPRGAWASPAVWVMPLKRGGSHGGQQPSNPTPGCWSAPHGARTSTSVCCEQRTCAAIAHCTRPPRICGSTSWHAPARPLPLPRRPAPSRPRPQPAAAPRMPRPAGAAAAVTAAALPWRASTRPT